MSLPEILRVFRGDAAFVGWIDANAVTGRADEWLRNGEPFRTALGATRQTLSFVQKMRNVIAHESDTAFDKYGDEARRLYGAMPKVLGPGYQLLTAPPTGLIGMTSATLFAGVTATFRWIAATIVH
jgi:hypothetical protein